MRASRPEFPALMRRESRRGATAPVVAVLLMAGTAALGLSIVRDGTTDAAWADAAKPAAPAATPTATRATTPAATPATTPADAKAPAPVHKVPAAAPATVSAAPKAATAAPTAAAATPKAVTAPQKVTAVAPKSVAATVPTKSVAAAPVATRPSTVSRAPAKPAVVQMTPPVEERVTYQYNALGRRDPFQAMAGGTFVGDDVGGDAPPDVGGLKVVGVVWGASDKFALVEDARGTSRVLRAGDKVMNGVVETLKRDAVIVKMTVDGQTETVAIPLARKGDQTNANR